MLYANQNYDRYMSSEQRDLRKLNILHQTETVGKQCSVDSDEQLEAQLRVALKVASKFSSNIS